MDEALFRGILQECPEGAVYIRHISDDDLLVTTEEFLNGTNPDTLLEWGDGAHIPMGTLYKIVQEAPKKSVVMMYPVGKDDVEIKTYCADDFVDNTRKQ